MFAFVDKTAGWRYVQRIHKHPSLYISHSRDRLLLKCWAGCTGAAIVAALGLTLADLFDGQRRQRTAPDAVAQRRLRAAAALEAWRQSEIRRCAEDLRMRDIIIRQIDGAVKNDAIGEDQALLSLEYEYRGYSSLEFRFARLVRNQDTLELWRKSRRAA
jgi:hypothetical protein